MPPYLAEPWCQFIAELGFTPTLDGPYDTLMQGWRATIGKLAARYTFPAPDPTIHTEDLIADGVRVRMYTPPPDTDSEPPTSNLPLALYFHAGGWIMGSVDEEDGFVRALCKLTHSTILSVAYRLAPAHRFPAPLDDCVAVARWALARFPTAQLTLIGASAGGNLALATALSLLDADADADADAEDALSARIAGVACLAPVTIHPDAVPTNLKERYTSYAENDRCTVNTGSAMRTFFECYGAPPGDPRVSVLLHAKVAGLRRVYLAVGGADTLRDDVRLFVERLEEEKKEGEEGEEGGGGGGVVAVRWDEFAGFPHFSWLFPAEVLRPHQAEFMGNLVRGVKWVQEE
ncbi:Alpha/Beta hydrolase protein [Aspergillus heterothallicus]